MNSKNELQAALSDKKHKNIKILSQYFVCAIILKFLYHGLRILYRHDERVKNDLDRIDKNTIIRLACSSDGPSLKVISTGNGILKCADTQLPDININFKDISFAFSVFTGQTGIAESFSKHMMYVTGDFSKIMSLVRCMEHAERYLFPSFITRRILKTLIPKRISSIRLYFCIIRSMIIG